MTQSQEHSSPRQAAPPSPHSLQNKLMRVLWGIVQATLFRCSPRPFHAWRNFLLRLFGAKLHKSARVYPRAKVWGPWNLVMHELSAIADDVDCYCVKPITIGARSTVSQYSYLCGATHDHERSALPLIPMPITIGEDVWIAADVFVAPGTTINDGVVVGARSSVFTDLPAWTICIGSPAKPKGPRALDSHPTTDQPNQTEEPSP
ncbi:MAG: hypothetical protein P1U30_08895 [Phycisphaerales bacterium]|nr:hypothetical protein [Phycisphaerales bacterium]